MQVVIASNNSGKIKEIEHSLKAHSFVLFPQSHFEIPDVEETETTFVGNAILKAKNACRHSKLPCIADDSGLIVPALGGEPGLYSARYAGKGASHQECIDKLLSKLQGIEERKAFFFCTIVFMKSELDPCPEIFMAKWHGEIMTNVQGTKGFGYDPIFFVPTHHCSAAELDINVKNKISHRGQALEKLADFIKNKYKND